MKKFDVIVGNPPYNDDTGNKGRGHILWDKFVRHSIEEWLVPNGYFCCVHPSLWRQDENELGKLLKSKQIEYLEVHDANDGLKTFGVTTRYDWYIIRNSPVNHLTRMKCQDGKLVDIDLNKWPFVPNGVFELITSLLHVEGKTEPVEIIKSESDYEPRQSWMSETQTETHIYPCVYYIPKNKEVSLKWSSVNDKGHFGVPKVIFCGGIFESTGLIVDKEGKYGMTQWCGAIVDKVENLDLIAKALRSPKFIEVNHALVTSKTELNVKALRHFRKDFWKSFLE